MTAEQKFMKEWRVDTNLDASHPFFPSAKVYTAQKVENMLKAYRESPPKEAELPDKTLNIFYNDIGLFRLASRRYRLYPGEQLRIKLAKMEGKEEYTVTETSIWRAFKELEKLRSDVTG